MKLSRRNLRLCAGQMHCVFVLKTYTFWKLHRIQRGNVRKIEVAKVEKVAEASSVST